MQLTKERGRPHHEPMNELGRRIRERREELGLNLIQGGQRCGLSFAALSQIETGKRENPRIDTLLKISRGLGISLEELTQELIAV